MLNDEILTRVNKCKYLGHVPSEDLSDDDDMARQFKRIYAQGNVLIRKVYMCTENVKCALFKSYCTSLYTCQLCYNYKSESIRKLCVAYNNVFRLLCNESKNCSASYYVCVTGITHLQNVDQEKCV